MRISGGFEMRLGGGFVRRIGGGIHANTHGYNVTRWGSISGAGTTTISLGAHKGCFLTESYGGMRLSSPVDQNEGACTLSFDVANNWSLNARVTYGWWVASCVASCLD